MSPSRLPSGVELSAQTRQAIAALHPWFAGAGLPNPDSDEANPAATAPSRAELARAVRLSAALLAELAPGHTVEVRIPPFAAVQCVEGPDHRRGTPPNVVQCSPLTWLRLVAGVEELASSDAEVSGSRADLVANYLPLVRVR